MTEFKHYVSSRWRYFMDLVDSDSIIVNQMLFYVLISMNGLFSLLTIHAGSQVVQDATSPGYYVFWLWLTFLGPLITIIGKLCRGHWAYTGLWLQLAGDISTWAIFVCYISAMIDTESWSRGSFAATLAMCCLLGTPIFVLKDFRKLRLVEARVRRVMEIEE